MARESLTIGIVALLLGVAFAPSLFADVETTSEKQELVEISVEFFGLKEKKSQNMTLTINDANILYLYLQNLEKKLANSKTKKETIHIFNDVIDELEKFSLLDSYDVNKIKKIIYENYLPIGKTNLINNLFNTNEDDFFNALCFICGFTSVTFSLGFLENLICTTLGELSYVFYQNQMMFGFVVFYVLSIITIYIYELFIPLRIVGDIYIGLTYCDLSNETLAPKESAEGWIFTLGQLGLKYCNDPKWGQLTKNETIPMGPGVLVPLRGVVGFSGLIVRIFNKMFYIGNALYVDIDPEFPF